MGFWGFGDDALVHAEACGVVAAPAIGVGVRRMPGGVAAPDAGIGLSGCVESAVGRRRS